MERHAPSRLNSQIYAEACAWFVECRSSNLGDALRREFDLWLRKSPEHLSAYLEIAAIWNEGPSLDPLHRWDAETLIAHAAEDQGEVVPLQQAVPSVPVRKAGVSPHTWRVRSIAASTAVLSVAGALAWFQLAREPTYTTGIGEQRSVALSDGSTVELNSRSRIEVRYSEHERGIDLLEGQALFKVAHDHARPFIVTSDGTRVRAVGTQFDVYKKHSGTIVTVVEGRVAILATVADPDLRSIAVDAPRLSLPSPESQGDEGHSKRDAAGAGILLTAGEQVTVTRATVEDAIRPNIASAIAWRQRQLVFESASLSEVAEEFNRYNEKQLVVENSDLYDFHISGVFSSTDPASLIRFLRERPGVQVIETPSQIQVAKKIHEEVTDL